MITIPNRILNKIYLLKRYRIIRKIEINYLVQTNSNEWILFFMADFELIEISYYIYKMFLCFKFYEYQESNDL